MVLRPSWSSLIDEASCILWMSLSRIWVVALIRHVLVHATHVIIIETICRHRVAELIIEVAFHRIFVVVLGVVKCGHASPWHGVNAMVVAAGGWVIPWQVGPRYLSRSLYREPSALWAHSHTRRGEPRPLWRECSWWGSHAPQSRMLSRWRAVSRGDVRGHVRRHVQHVRVWRHWGAPRSGHIGRQARSRQRTGCHGNLQSLQEHKTPALVTRPKIIRCHVGCQQKKTKEKQIKKCQP